MRSWALLLIACLGLAEWAPSGSSRSVIRYGEPTECGYVTPVERVVVVAREVLVSRGWEVCRVEERGPNRIIWARRGEDEVVRVFATPAGERVAVRTVAEQRDRGRHRGWERREPPREIVGDIDGRLREHRDH